MLRTTAAVVAGKAARAVSRLRGGGSALPGLVAERVDPGFLAHALADVPRGIVVVSGTNGKTTTTKMLVAVLRAHGLSVFTNPTGSNFTRGVISSMLGELEVEERFSLTARWGATLFAGAAGLYGEAPVPLDRSIYPTVGAGVHFVIKPKERMNVNLEYAQGIEGNHGLYLKLGYAW